MWILFFWAAGAWHESAAQYIDRNECNRWAAKHHYPAVCSKEKPK